MYFVRVFLCYSPTSPDTLLSGSITGCLMSTLCIPAWRGGVRAAAPPAARRSANENWQEDGDAQILLCCLSRPRWRTADATLPRPCRRARAARHGAARGSERRWDGM